MKYHIKTIGILTTLSLGVVIYLLFDPTSTPFFPKCPLYATTGILCPGCGSQRTIHALLNLHIAEALRTNALLVLSIPYVALIVLSIFLRPRHSWAERLYGILTGTRSSWILLVVIITWFILRNVL